MKKRIITLSLATALLVTTHTPAHAATFTDVPKNHWAYEVINDISTRGIINGYLDGTYRLNHPVTRAQAAKIVALAIDVKPSATYKPSFQDVGPAHGSYNHIRALTELGIFTDGDKFQPNKPLTRAEMSKMFALGYNIILDDNDKITFSDVAKQNQYHGYITALAELGVTTTPEGGEFKPNDDVSRAHIAAFLYRTMEFNTAREKGLIIYDKVAKAYVDKDEAVNSTDDSALKTITLVNQQRTQQNAAALIHDKELSKVAQAKAQDMVKNNYFGHTSPVYGSTSQLLATFNYKWTAYGENIAKGQRTPEEVVQDWMDSPTHRANIVNKKFTHIGTGYATDANGTTYWVHEFSRK